MDRCEGSNRLGRQGRESDKSTLAHRGKASRCLFPQIRLIHLFTFVFLFSFFLLRMCGCVYSLHIAFYITLVSRLRLFFQRCPRPVIPFPTSPLTLSILHLWNAKCWWEIIIKCDSNVERHTASHCFAKCEKSVLVTISWNDSVECW